MSTLGMGILVLVLVALIARVGIGASGADQTTVKKKIEQGAAVIDVRTPAEYESGHYRGARNIPLQELKARLPQLGNRNSSIVVYCASGMRSAQAAKILAAAGFADVTNAGGLSNLKP